MPAINFTGVQDNKTFVESYNERWTELRQVLADNSLFTRVSNVTNGKQFLLEQESGDLGLHSSFCNLSDSDIGQASDIVKGFTTQTWELGQIVDAYKLCDDLETDSLMNYLVRMGNNADELGKLDISNYPAEVANYIFGKFASAIMRIDTRLGWHGDKAVPGLVSGVSVELYNKYDGWFKRATQGIADGSIPAENVTTIAKNSEATKAAQKLADGEAYNILEEMYDGFSNELKEDEFFDASQRPLFICTKAFFQNLKAYYRETLANHTASRLSRTEANIQELDFEGYRVVEEKSWEKHLNRFDDGTVFDKPHRVVFTSPANLLLGEDENRYMIDFWFDRNTKSNRFDFKIMNGTLIGDRSRFAIAW